MVLDRGIRQTELYGKVCAYFRAVNAVGQDWVVDAADITTSADGRRVAFTGTVHQDLVRAPVTRICLLDLATGALTRVEVGKGSDRLPRWSPDGTEQRVTDLTWEFGRGATQLEMPSLRFSPDGRQMYFSELIDSAVRVKRIDLDGREKVELYRLPKASRAEVSPDVEWIAYQEYPRNYLTPFNYVGKLVTVSADDGVGASLRIDAPHDGLYHLWSRDSRSLMWTRGPEFVEKTLEDVIAGNGKVATTNLAVAFRLRSLTP